MVIVEREGVVKKYLNTSDYNLLLKSKFEKISIDEVSNGDLGESLFIVISEGEFNFYIGVYSSNECFLTAFLGNDKICIEKDEATFKYRMNQIKNILYNGID